MNTGYTLKDEKNGTWTLTIEGLRAPFDGTVYVVAPEMLELLKDIRAGTIIFSKLDKIIAMAEGQDK